MYYSGKDYEMIDEIALRLRIDYNHFEKPLDIFKLAKQLNIILTKYSTLTLEQLETVTSKEELKDGFTIFKKKNNGEYEFYTYYNDSIEETRIRLTIAHEIKHIVFLEKDPTEKDEDLANHFARYILVPTCLVMPYVEKLSIRDIVDDFNVSYEAACNAYKTAENRLIRKKLDMSDYENEFMDCFNNKNKNLRNKK